MEAWRLLRTRWAAGRGTSRAHCWRARKALSPHNCAVTSVPHAPQVGAGQGTRGPCRPGLGTGMTKAQESPAYQQADPTVAHGPHGGSTERPGPRTAWRKVVRPPVPPGTFPSSARHRWKGVWFPEKQNFPKKAVGVPGPSVPKGPRQGGLERQEVQEEDCLGERGTGEVKEQGAGRRGRREPSGQPL